MLKLLILTVSATTSPLPIQVTNSKEIIISTDLCILPDREECATPMHPFTLTTSDDYDRGFYMRYCTENRKNSKSFPVI